jgi:tetratricopeptide (TPR) repeat protein
LQNFPTRDTAAFHLASAIIAIRKAESGVASDQLQNAIALDPKSSQPHTALASLYMLLNNPKHAGDEFKIAASLSPLRSAERTKYAEFQASTGATTEAKKSLEEMTRQAPDFVTAWRLLAQVAVSEKKYDDALALLENVFNRDPDNPDARLLQSNVWETKGDNAKAIAILDKLNAAFPNNDVVKFQLGQAYLLNHDTTKAIAAFEQAVAIQPDFPDAIVKLAESNLRTGKPEVVVPPLEALLREHPDLSEARLLLANAYQAMGRVQDAGELFRAQAKIVPNSADAYFLLGQSLRREKKKDEARQAFEKAAELAPGNSDPIDQLVELDLSDSRIDQAAARIKEFGRTNPGPSVEFMQAKVYIAQKNWTQAEAALQNAIQLDANFTAAYNLLVAVDLAQNKLPQAISQLEAALQKNPDNSRALVVIGMIYEQMKDFAKARDAYEKVLTTTPDAVPALNNLAYLYAERFNQLDKAYELAQKARTLQPTNGAIADTFGWIVYKRGDYRQALQVLQESVGKKPEDPEIQFHFGMANYMTGETAAARSALEQAAHSPADFPGKEEAQRRLALLGGTGNSQPEISVADLETLVKGSPNDVIALQRLAEAYNREGQAAKAAATYEQVLKINPNLLNAVVQLAQLYAGPLHDRDKTFEFAKKARTLAPNDTRAAGALGRIVFQAGNFTWANSLLQESARAGNNDPGVLYDLALSSYLLGKVSEARSMMQRVLDAKPDSQAQEAKRFLAMTALDDRSPNLTAAEPEIEATLKSQPDYVPALMAQAATFMQRHDSGAAANIYSKLLEKYPDFALAQKRLAAIYANNSDSLSKAYDLAMKARKVLPDDPDLARTLARISFERSDFPYSAQLFEQSAAKEPLATEDLYYLGVAQMQSRQESKGRDSLQRALSAGLKDPLAQDAKKRLAGQGPK